MTSFLFTEYSCNKASSLCFKLKLTKTNKINSHSPACYVHKKSYLPYIPSDDLESKLNKQENDGFNFTARKKFQSI